MSEIVIKPETLTNIGENIQAGMSVWLFQWFTTAEDALADCFKVMSGISIQPEPKSGPEPNK